MSRFHGTRHIKGGFEIDENKLSPNANYWKIYARGSYKELVKLFGEEKAGLLYGSVLYSTEKKWKEKWSEIEDILTLTENEINDKIDKLPNKSLPMKAWWVGICGGQLEGRIRGCGKPFSMLEAKHVDGFMKCPHCGNLN